MKRRLSHHGILFAGILAVMLLSMTACTYAPTSPTSPTSPGQPASEYTVMTVTKTDIGEYLVDGAGRTLYYFTRDSAGKSSANEAIILVWPIFYAANIVVPSNLNASDFATITRNDGKMQTTFKGWPLYYYTPDLKAGDTNGQGVGGVWYVVTPATIPPAQ